MIQAASGIRLWQDAARMVFQAPLCPSTGLTYT